jgi:hypothetical protein
MMQEGLLIGESDYTVMQKKIKQKEEMAEPNETRGNY